MTLSARMILAPHIHQKLGHTKIMRQNAEYCFETKIVKKNCVNGYKPRVFQTHPKVSTSIICLKLNPLEYRGNYSATSNNIKLVHCPLMGGLLHLVQRGGAATRPGPSSLYQI